jgi:hypothetical protein
LSVYSNIKIDEFLRIITNHINYYNWSNDFKI